MKRHLFAIGIAIMLSTAAHGYSTVVTETIRLRYLDVKSVPTKVKPPRGIELLTLNLNDGSITVTGDRDAVTAYKADLRASDVQLTAYRLSMRLVRFHVGARGSFSESVVMTPTILDIDGCSSSISMKDGNCAFAIALTPHRAAENTILLTVEVQQLGEQGEVVRSGKNEKRVPLGHSSRITGMTDSVILTLRRAAQRGEVVKDQGEYTGYYVEVTPSADQPASTPE